MAKEKIVSAMKIIGMSTIPLAATAAYVYSKKKVSKEEYASCPVCGTIIDKTQKKCNYCGSPIQTCVSCGCLFHGEARHCPKCGTESIIAGMVTVTGATYRPPINEPFPTEYISHSYCCCGTPFAEGAAYCQLCGRKRPKPGTYYLRERKSEKS